MLPIFRRLWFQFTTRFALEEGQDLVEYALIVAMLSFCAIAAEQNIAVSINGVYANLSTKFSSFF